MQYLLGNVFFKINNSFNKIVYKIVYFNKILL